MYPTFNADRSQIYFCSNREEANFDLYYVDVDPEMDLEQLLSHSAGYSVLKDTSLSSHADDKCPFIFNNKMVFTSNRAGAFGSFDLYYSMLDDVKWSAPVNFGAKINSEYNDYRTVLVEEGVSQIQKMMVFSSDRPGGAGGFDLYFAGINNE